MNNEIWKDIAGYEGIYQASNLGNIRTTPNKTTFTKKHGIRHWKTRILKGRGNNYKTGKRVMLWKDGKSKSFLVARLVAYTFYNKDFNDHSLTVNHIDGNRFNNNISNLEIITIGDNLRHAFDTGLMPYKKVKLYNENFEKVFRSLTLASQYIGRNHGYISLCLYKKRKIKDKNGNEYFVKFLEKGE